ncbi:glycoside hydrolase family 2 TIM barrel-domain containing protein [Olivibacter sp. CPCC 100613]|uniref:sugar-binding domain-containing protein n=1 Tax=Olivibacter sp. CPCC 100613 TaxID=3079931 RepID=UPI002FF49891
MFKTIATFFLLYLVTLTLYGQEWGRSGFNSQWKFYLGDEPEAKAAGFNDKGWRNIDLPHDWSIEGTFSKEHPATNQGGALPGGIAWYRKTFQLADTIEGKQVYIDFDGIYRNSEVWINGHYLGKRPSGYTSFRYDLTPYMNIGKQSNVIAVRVDNSQQPNSRWYSGSGIYRNVWLITKNKIAIDHWGLFITSPSIQKEQATIRQQTVFKNLGSKREAAEVTIRVFDKESKLVVKKAFEQSLIPGDSEASYEIQVPQPILWSPENPYCYRVETQVYIGKRLVDQHSSPFGIRSFSFDEKEGFSLNGQRKRILGVCMHHDLGALGAAINRKAMERQLVLLKEMGANAIRISHNPPAPEFLDLCDSIGFLVMDEAFDMWRKKKNKFDYSLDFDEWHRQDLTDLIKRDRNHPSIIMWSIGNEIREQFDSTGTALTKELVAIVRSEDNTRPVVAALTETHLEKNFIAQANALDILGFNYKYEQYDSLPINFPGQKFIASETTSALATRGHYDLGHDTLRFWPPSAKEKFVKNGNADFTVSAYDQVAAYWGTSHEQAWRAVKQRDFMTGLFVWTGFDYLGEPVPYDFPARSSYYGIIDLAGFPKDVYYMYQSEWTDQPVLHLLPHWNWHSGQTIDVWAYYNQADEVELFLNGRSLGTRKKQGDDIHVSWKVPFQRGELKAVSRKNGKEVLSKEIKTASKPARIQLTVDKNKLRAGINDLAFVSATIVDADGNTAPMADDEIVFDIRGRGFIAGVDNGFQADLSPLKGNRKRAYNGKCLAIIQAKTATGEIILKASAKGLEGAELKLEVNDE